eukprot:jgi/Undpi1/4104/HiC_scaffold_16.g07471.m1
MASLSNVEENTPPSPPPPPPTTRQDARDNKRAASRGRSAARWQQGEHLASRYVELEREDHRQAILFEINTHMEARNISAGGGASSASATIDRSFGALHDAETEDIAKLMELYSEKAKLRAQARQDEEERLRPAGGGSGGGGGGGGGGGCGGGGAAGLTFGSEQSDVRHIMSLLAAAGPNPIAILNAIEEDEGSRLHTISQHNLDIPVGENTTLCGTAMEGRVRFKGGRLGAAHARLGSLRDLLEVCKWEEGKLYNRFVERTRDGGSETDVFVAERVVKTWESWMVYLKQLGQGGFGCVSEMGVPTLDLKLAVKTLKLTGDGINGSDAMAIGVHGLIAEMIVLSRLPSHPHITGAVGMNDFDQQSLLVAYPLADGDLLEPVTRRTSMVESTIMRLFIEAGAGFAFMHLNGYCHNDIKPDNVLFFNDGPDGKSTAKVSDLGLTLGERST